MKNVFQITGIVAIFLALLIPQSSYGQVKIGDIQ
jgi:choline-glycine betaine transporter